MDSRDVVAEHMLRATEKICRELWVMEFGYVPSTEMLRDVVWLVLWRAELKIRNLAAMHLPKGMVTPADALPHAICGEACALIQRPVGGVR